jgi:hypothetical protein
VAEALPTTPEIVLRTWRAAREQDGAISEAEVRVAATGGITGEDVRDLMVAALDGSTVCRAQSSG